MQNVNYGSLFLMSDTTAVIVIIAVAVAALAIGWFVGWILKDNSFKKKQGDIRRVTDKMIEAAKEESKQIKKEAILEAKEQEIKLRNDFERETREKRAEFQKTENRLNQKEESLEKKEENLAKRNEETTRQQNNLKAKEAELDKKLEDISNQHDKMIAEFEKISQMSKEEAKQQLIDAIYDEARKDAAGTVKNIEAEAKEEGERRAREIVSLAIQKCSTDQASEITVSVVPLPSDDMKARIIGREGRNIRTLENATGIELIIDDTPEVVIVSGFDPVRRETARITLEKLIQDGRIHPARIEETVEKVKKDLDAQIKEAGEAAMFDCGIFGLHPEIVKLLGRLKFRTSYGQNVLKHSIEVSHLAGVMATELGVDVNLAKRAGLLHDLGKAVDFEIEGTHMQIGADLAKKYRENNNVVNAILAHHGDVEPKTIEAVLVQAADAISGARPGARRETTTNYIKRLQKLEEIASGFKGVDNCYAIQAGREVRVIVKPEQVSDANTVFLAKDIAKKIEQEMEYPGQIKVNVIRETRATEFAK
ncbi:MAG: ribonuclease Y [Candidatus Borkfalkiaceae bacterium]|nr:ribonuclease Y [Christensenellaceae bacterium]